MAATVFVLAIALLGQTTSVPNPISQDLLDHGIRAGETTVLLPAPTLIDGRDAEAGRAVLRAVAGDDRNVENFVRDSVSAPFVLRTRDIKADAAIVRAADLYFVVRGNLDEVDIKQVLGKVDESTVEAANMRVTNKLLKDQDLTGRRVDRLGANPHREEWFSHTAARLLDRIAVESTDHVVATRTADSLTVAAVTSRAFDDDTAFSNRWTTITRAGATETTGPARVYPGGGSYAKITRLQAEPGALFVEVHFAFVEPMAWFDGNPILRSKFSVICQDQVRQLRREIQKRRAGK